MVLDRFRVSPQPVKSAIRTATSGIINPPANSSSQRKTVAPPTRYSAQTLNENRDASPASQTTTPTKNTDRPRGAAVHSRNQPTTGSSKAKEVDDPNSTTSRNTTEITNRHNG